ncbi:hypothetical protein C8Q74DRAFT_1248419 [Fomes fomentarius]|nr:hypothetical protein C8Q74DRAFT_1248419 [Fomes fomentarius]
MFGTSLIHDESAKSMYPQRSADDPLPATSEIIFVRLLHVPRPGAYYQHRARLVPDPYIRTLGWQGGCVP